MTAVHSPRRSGGAPVMPCSPGLLTIAQIVTSHKLPSGAGQACQTALLRMLQTAMHRAQDKHALLRMLPLMPPVPHPSLTSVKPFNLHIVHIQCLLQVDGSTLAGVFLTSSFCVVPESSYSSNEASGSLLIAWYTQTLVALSQQCMASF